MSHDSEQGMQPICELTSGASENNWGSHYVARVEHPSSGHPNEVTLFLVERFLQFAVAYDVRYVATKQKLPLFKL